MTYQEWVSLLPAGLSGVAALAAAWAAVKSLHISRESKDLAEQNALAAHHAATVTMLSDIHEILAEELKPLTEAADRLQSDWGREIERQCRVSGGGKDPRPLRHVLFNGARMLGRHAISCDSDSSCSGRSMYSLVSGGMGDTSDDEYKRLLQVADGAYQDFESVFGSPSIHERVECSPAFRWVYYQAIKRVSLEDWRAVWREAWEEDGCLAMFIAAYHQLVPALQNQLKKLQRERARLSFTAFPLENNEILSNAYERTMGFIETVLESDHLGELSGSWDCDADDIVRWVLFAMGMGAYFSYSIDAFSSSLHGS